MPAAVTLAHDPLALHLKRVLALFLISTGLVAVLGRMRLSSLALPCLAVLGAAGLSLLAAVNRYEGLLAIYLYGLLCIGLLTWMASALQRREQILWLLVAVVAAAAVTALAGVVQFAVPSSFASWGARGAAIGTMANPNYFGAYLATVAPLAAGLVLGADRPWHRRLGLAALGVITLGLLASRTRAAWLGFLGGLGMVALLGAASRLRRHGQAPRSRAAQRPALLLAATVLAAFVLGTALAAWRGESIVARFASIFDRSDSSSAARLQWWREALDMIRDHPILGVGIGNSPFIFLRYNRAPESTPFSFLFLEHLHNEPLALAAELGLAGVAATGIFLAALARLARRALPGPHGQGDPLALGVVGGLVAAGIDSLFFFNLHEMTSATAIWVSVGLLEALARQGSEQAIGGSGVRGFGSSRKADPARARWLRAGVAAALAGAFWAFAVRPGVAAYYARRGMVELDAGRAGEALGSLEAARAWDRRNDLAHYLLGQALEETGRLDEAVRSYEDALRLNPLDVASLNSLGTIHRRAGRMAEAREAYRRALGINPNVPTTHANLGQLSLAQGRPAEAAGHFRRALDLLPRHAPAANGLGVAYIQLDRPDEAQGAFRRAVQSDPTFAEAWLNLFTLHGSRGEWGGAAEALAQVLRLRPGLEAEARRRPFFDRVWAAGVAQGILPVRTR